MSIRYVWNRYTVNTTKQQRTVTSISYPVGSTGFVADSYEERGNVFTLTGDIHNMDYETISQEGERFDSRDFPYFIKGGTSGTTIYESSHIRYSWWIVGNYLYTRYDDGTDDGRPVNYEITEHRYATVMGSLIGQISASSQRYPTNGASGSYWYVYRGSDNIDPSISYDSKQILTKEVTISLTPSTAIQYGGTITYDYQVNIDGTDWVDIGSTTATSMNYTIPATATQFRARVRARDNMGFTSTTWVTGPLATVAPPYVRTRLRRKNASGTYDLIHLMTSADSVVQDDGSNVQDIINNIKQRLNLS